METIDALAARLRAALSDAQVLTDRQELRTYECDGLAHYKVIPALVVFPRTGEECAFTVRACVDAGVPFVARGSGTGLSGGALPHAEGVLIVTSQMRAILEIAPEDERAVVEPGAINLALTRVASPHGYYYAPDPSSQQVCSIGGNLAENSGGVHCLKYGFTTNHVTGAEVVLADGSMVHIGGQKAPDAPGYDLLGTLVGSEGTLGIATKIWLRVVREPEAVKTLLAAFEDTEQAGDAVSGIIGAGIVPAAIEMMDRLCIEAVEVAVHPGFPDAGALLIVELDGPEAEVDDQFEQTVKICEETNASEIKVAEDDAERALFWKGRKAAFGAMGRISNDYYVQDSVVPRTELGAVLKKISDLSGEYGLRVANVFHAGDGNLHPLVLYDNDAPGEAERAERLAGEIVFACLEHGGSLTGEHGIGVDKRKYMPKMFSEDDMNVMQLLRCAFDPHRICNPGKIFPTPRLCGERPGPFHMHPVQKAGLAENF